MNSIQKYIKRAGEYDGILPVAKNQRITKPLPATCSISVIIPAYNEESTIIQCLESLRNQKDHSGNKLSYDIYEVIVINNNSTDTTAQTVEQWIQEHKLPNFHLITESQQGVASARKRGFDEVVYRCAQRKSDQPHYLLSADADDTVFETWINAYSIAFLESKSDLIIGTSSFDDQPLKQYPNIKRYIAFKKKWEDFFKQLYLGRAEGHNYGVSLESYAAVGGIKRQYYFEEDKVVENSSDDWVFSAELIEKGFKVNFHPEIAIKRSPRKLTKCIENIIQGDIYLKNWKDLKTISSVTRDFTNEELHQIIMQQVHGIIAHQMLMNIYLWPNC